MSVRKFKKKPVVIEAIQWSGENIKEIKDFTDGSSETNRTLEQLGDKLIISTLEGNVQADINDFIIKGIEGEFYPCKPDIFKKTYKPID